MARRDLGKARVLLLALPLAVHVGCGAEPGSPAEAPREPSRADKSELDRPFVAFMESRLVIEALGAPVRPPVTAGSSPSNATLVSMDPSVVQVLPDGSLLARRHGKVLVHGTGGAVLEVEVPKPEPLWVEGNLLGLSPGEATPVAAVASRGGPPAHEVRWTSTDPEIARVVAGAVHARAPGECEIVARRGAAEGRAKVTVRTVPISVTPTAARTRPGQILVFEVRAASMPVTASWSHTEAGVIRGLGANVFQAIRRGRTRVCATAFQQKVCADVEVTP